MVSRRGREHMIGSVLTESREEEPWEEPREEERPVAEAGDLFERKMRNFVHLVDHNSI
jgi:hypothetical protein